MQRIILPRVNHTLTVISTKKDWLKDKPGNIFDGQKILLEDQSWKVNWYQAMYV